MTVCQKPLPLVRPAHTSDIELMFKQDDIILICMLSQIRWHAPCLEMANTLTYIVRLQELARILLCKVGRTV